MLTPPGTTDPLYINGRFVAQRQSGVQRFCGEIARELGALHGARARLLVPEESRLAGQAWEQIALPRLAAGGRLVNLGNTAPLFGRRQLVVIHDAGVFSTPEAYSWKFRLWYKGLQALLVRAGTSVVTVSEFSRGEIARRLGAHAGRIAVMPEGADHMDRIAADGAALAAHGLQAGKFVLVVGNLAAHKNLDALGALAAMLARRGLPLVITGGLGGAAFRTSAIARLPQPARYVGRLEDGALKALYEAAACFVLPSRYEGFGLPAVEAMRCGCPVVAADIPALRETCGEAAVFCDPRAPEDIAARVAGLLGDAGARRGLSAAGRARTREMTWARAARVLDEVIARL